MSAEFGDNSGGTFFHHNISNSADACKEEGQFEFTKLFGKLLESMEDLAYKISLAEVGDSCESSLIIKAIKEMPNIEAKFENIKKYLEVYEEVYNAMVEKVVESKLKEEK